MSRSEKNEPDSSINIPADILEKLVKLDKLDKLDKIDELEEDIKTIKNNINKLQNKVDELARIKSEVADIKSSFDGIKAGISHFRASGGSNLFFTPFAKIGWGLNSVSHADPVFISEAEHYRED